MKNSESKINYETKPIPTSPGAQQITVEGTDSKKGGSSFVSELPKKFVIPGDTSSKKGGFSSK